MNTLSFFQYMEIEKAKYMPLPKEWRKEYASLNINSQGDLCLFGDPVAVGYKIPKDVVVLHLTVVKQMFPNAKIVVNGKRKYKTVEGAIYYFNQS